MLSRADKNDNMGQSGLDYEPGAGQDLVWCLFWIGKILGGREQSDKFFCPLQLENNSVNLDVEEEVRECELSSLWSGMC